MRRCMSARHGEPEPIAPKRHQAPSRARYAAVNPAHTVRFKPKAHAKILAICERTGLSYNQAVNIAVDQLDAAAMEVIRAHGNEQGFREGVKAERAERAAAYAASAKKFVLTQPCVKCGQPIELGVGNRGAIVYFLEMTKSGLVHVRCPSPPDKLGTPASDVR
jgi:hypothetical protein